MNEENLIFIVSQPRSGSTVLQKLISNNDLVGTSSEPWILLRYTSVLKPDLLRADFNFDSTHAASSDFLAKHKYPLFQKTKDKLLDIYEAASDNYRYFLDKTPRYYEILDSIVDLFPNAKFVILKRHPAAVLYSMLSTWSRSKIDFSQIFSYDRDFRIAPQKILDFETSQERKNNTVTVYYENLVDDPVSTAGFIYEWLGIPFDETRMNIGENQKTKGIFGDDVYNTNRPVKYKSELVEDSKAKWVSQDSKGEIINFISGYLKWLGPKFIESYGYPADFPETEGKHKKLYSQYLSYTQNVRLKDITVRDFINFKIENFCNKRKGLV